MLFKTFTSHLTLSLWWNLWIWNKENILKKKKMKDSTIDNLARSNTSSYIIQSYQFSTVYYLIMLSFFVCSHLSQPQSIQA